MDSRPDWRQAGFTLNEILVAISVIVIAILGYALNTIGVVRGNATSGNLTIAVNLAQDKLEELKGEKNLANGNQCPDGGERGITAAGQPGGIFSRCWTVSDSVLGSNLKRVDVTVFWQDYEPRKVLLSTLVFTGSGAYDKDPSG